VSLRTIFCARAGIVAPSAAFVEISGQSTERTDDVRNGAITKQDGHSTDRTKAEGQDVFVSCTLNQPPEIPDNGKYSRHFQCV